jgi:hypothetical protein
VKRRRAFLLLLSLLLTTLLLVVVLGFLGARSMEFASTTRIQQSAIAQALAEAGMEDARVKLEKDLFFPPINGFNQVHFTYTEELTDPDTGVLAGTFTVTVDTRRRASPYSVFLVQALGCAGARTNPTARYQIYAEVDCSITNRATGASPNPRLFRYINWREGDVDSPLPALPLPL